MKLSAYIAELAKLLAEHGDLPVLVNSSDIAYTMQPGLVGVEKCAMSSKVGVLTTNTEKKAVVIG